MTERASPAPRAMHLCQQAGKPFEAWLHEAITGYLTPVTDAMRKETIEAKTIIRYLTAVVAAMGTAPKPRAEHFRAAATQEGVSEPTIKKCWQRNSSVFQLAQHLKR